MSTFGLGFRVQGLGFRVYGNPALAYSGKCNSRIASQKGPILYKGLGRRLFL